MFKNIEILRFLFVISVMCHHLIFLNKLNIEAFNKIVPSFYNAFRAVDYFFIIAGFFLFYKTDFTQKFSDFAKKKFLRLMPVLIFMTFIYWIVSLFTPINFSIYENVFALCNIHNVGLTLDYVADLPSWFISSLFWTLCFYFYFYKIAKREWFNLICALIIFFCLALSLHSKGNIYTNVCYVFNRGMIRAFAGIGIGYFVCMFYKDNIEAIKGKVLNVWQTFFIGVIESYLLFFTVYYTFMHKLKYNNSYILILAFIALFILFLLKKGFLSKFLENNISVFLGQFTFSLFLSHYLIRDLWKIYLTNNTAVWVQKSPELTIFIILLTFVFFGIFIYYVFEKPVSKFIKSKYLAK